MRVSPHADRRVSNMCHVDRFSLCAVEAAASGYVGTVAAQCYGGDSASRRIAVLPDIYGVTPFYRGLSSYLSGHGATVYLVNPWEPFGELPEMTRQAAWVRRHKIGDRAFCNDLAKFLERESIDALIGFCIGGNFLFEVVRRGFTGTCCAFYPLPWGMANRDGLQPPFEYMERLDQKVTVLMGGEDPLAGAANLERLRKICDSNPSLELHLYESSGHGFLADLDSEEPILSSNARNALGILLNAVFADSADGPASGSAQSSRESGGGGLLP